MVDEGSCLDGVYNNEEITYESHVWEKNCDISYNTDVINL